MPITVYLCGPITIFEKADRYQDAISWRISLGNKLKKNGINVFDPTVGFDYAYGLVSDKSVVQQNMYYLDKCDVIVANSNCLLDSLGSLYEIFYYGWMNKPVIILGKIDTYSPHVNGAITEQFATEDEIIDYLTNFYCQ
jgi:nucleoside 2-deoxyribosyltransferase